ncbi:pyridoxamine 5'-phosphate oxidase family protein [Streptomyces endophyticus]|uniref:Pyridoxamine 5'-phosphate oxidase family protein n=1 Tax=Streptomyces endophyticus TaxID=714166 RepID=A0ABU6FLM3_9ACTN|nr:pyridoxamine 5'-phosphate oxidase family protein [Streptomyces endophyticus]MEB8344175.1 pyridoxamine 5'-phosphate oxidase family protein [Streptomyces endophyticus]
MPSDAQKDPQKTAVRQDRDRAFELLARVPYGRVATSMRALPFLASARHIVADGRLLLRMHRGLGYHEACIGSVVAYGTDSLGQESPEDAGQWSVQCVGTCEQVEPTTAELELFGPTPHYADDELFDPVYLCVAPQFVTVHELRGGSAHSSPCGD